MTRRIIEALCVVLIIVIGGLIFSLQIRPPDQRPQPPVNSREEPRTLPVSPSEPSRPEPDNADTGKSANLRPAGNPGYWITTDDYPPRALRNNEQGTVSFVLDVNEQGVPTRCTIPASSGSQMLDKTSCDMLMVRARFKPARDPSGKPIKSQYRSRVVWKIPE